MGDGDNVRSMAGTSRGRASSQNEAWEDFLESFTHLMPYQESVLTRE